MDIKWLLLAGGIVLGSGGTLYLNKMMKPEIKLECKPAPCNCPEQKPCQGIDFDKIKSKYITIENQQYLTIKGDTLLVKNIREALREELNDFKVRKCK